VSVDRQPTPALTNDKQAAAAEQMATHPAAFLPSSLKRRIITLPKCRHSHTFVAGFAQTHKYANHEAEDAHNSYKLAYVKRGRAECRTHVKVDEILRNAELDFKVLREKDEEAFERHHIKNASD
jgi:hypothetical protein